MLFNFGYYIILLIISVSFIIISGFGKNKVVDKKKFRLSVWLLFTAWMCIVLLDLTTGIWGVSIPGIYDSGLTYPGSGIKLNRMIHALLQFLCIVSLATSILFVIQSFMEKEETKDIAGDLK